jgi:exopolyphosphatase/guanosine-5'-triphosphate,3'-diphosphate pyrophosphatase
LNKYFAAIDMGTNSFHLIIVKVNDDGSFTIVDREREVIRLGSSQGNEMNFISEKEIERAITILKSFKKLADVYNARIYTAATSAIRESSNKEIFVKRVEEETSIKINIIEGSKEAELIYLGIQKALDVYNKKILCVDIGGGSTEIILGDKGKILFAESLKIGAVRLTKKFFPDFILTEEGIKDCLEFIEESILTNKNILQKENFDLAVGSSGTIQSAASMILGSRSDSVYKPTNNVKFSYKNLKKLSAAVLRKKRPEERILIPGMEEKRADIIPAGLLILIKIFDIFKICEMTTSGFALREGMILEIINRSFKPLNLIS